MPPLLVEADCKAIEADCDEHPASPGHCASRSAVTGRSEGVSRPSRSLSRRATTECTSSFADGSNSSCSSMPKVLRSPKALRPWHSLEEVGAPEEILSLWAEIRAKTRSAATEQMISRRGLQRHWDLAAGEGLDWEHIRNQRYACTVPFCRSSEHREGEVSADDCIAEILRVLPQRRVKLLDLGCGVGAFLARLKQDGTRIDWSSSFGVTSVHPADIAMFTPPADDPDFFDKHIARFDLDCLAEHVEKDLAGNHFDVITSHYCFCHLKDALGALCISFELLEPDGLLFFVEPLHVHTTSLPYTDSKSYSSSDELGAGVQLQRLLDYWVSQGVRVFSSCQPRCPQRHVLALRRPTSRVRLTLPPWLAPSAVPPSTSPESLRQQRAKDLQPFMSPQVPGGFKEWLSASGNQSARSSS
eukprot:TRINITY_DN105725_c0_g1_i1.p1 TRINITY_DN105725_c0_g1~~TRINITY_DN105725_c0_g1_i1.p1  ORF type:complete len:428 (+),score=67.58 TRINITY_DN105725_c0_g1_i1:40-1284(+)